MKKSISLLHKVKLLLKRIGAPIYINKYGPKQYTLAEKLYSLFLRSEWKSSFRRTVKLSKDIGITTQSKSTLHYTLHKIHWTFIKHMLKATVLRHAYLVAIDGSSLGRNFPSWHYILRAGINILERKPVKLSIALLLNCGIKEELIQIFLSRTFILSARFKSELKFRFCRNCILPY